MLPYGLIVLLAAIVMAARHELDDGVPRRSKRIVIGVLIGSLAVPQVLIGWGWLGMLLQLGVCIYLIFYNLVADEAVNSRNAERSAGRSEATPQAAKPKE